VTTATRVGDLDENQMAIMQNKIQQVEGAIPGDSLSWDSEDIPAEISGMLPAMVRKPIRPSAVPRRAGAFDLDMSAPVDVDGFTGGLGGPGVGTHSNPTAPWYIAFGNDIGGAEGTPVYAAFDGHVTKFKPHDPAADTAKVYGAEIFMRSNNDLMGAFYTHLTNVSGSIRPGAYVSRGDYLGTIHRQGSTATHLHMALVEIIGGAPNGQYKGVNLYDFLDWLERSDGSTVVPVRFWQDGRPPEPQWNGAALGVMPMPIEPFAPIAPLAPVTPPLDGAQTNGVHAYGDGRYAGVPSGPNAS
jgi:murein DD-endopeptidase MepM/ murein hydrolase activator NlpD